MIGSDYLIIISNYSGLNR